MEKQTPITDAATQQLELKKQFIAEYSNKMTAFFTEKVKTAFDAATQELETKHRELMQQSQEMLQNSNVITLKTDEPTDKQTGTTAYGNE